jgi:hypothetical protein
MFSWYCLQILLLLLLLLLLLFGFINGLDFKHLVLFRIFSNSGLSVLWEGKLVMNKYSCVALAWGVY